MKFTVVLLVNAVKNKYHNSFFLGMTKVKLTEKHVCLRSNFRLESFFGYSFYYERYDLYCFTVFNREELSILFVRTNRIQSFVL